MVSEAQDDISDLIQDLVAIIYSFSARLYGLRRAKKKTSNEDIKTMSEICGTYEFKHFANKGKTDKIKEVFKEYSKTAKNISNFLRKEFFKNGKLPYKKKISIKHIQSNYFSKI